MSDLLTKARSGRLAALEHRGRASLIREAAERYGAYRGSTVIEFQTRRLCLAN
ncbi:hypothetical protein [Szabonella alba]|uniref:Uncharacterized protein n=1 Tax=Szabonella alba TaxID=2804194 RepID=A0A8K0VAP6_9RHOB|nr:hypothetical protein [Szabonella alba]MBL4918206.1 hypothetical protein [Szabonella alba]